MTKYYYAGAQRVAVRTNGTLNFLFGDHLGSTGLVTDIYGNAVLSEMRYREASLWDTPWGEVRYNAGTTPTDYTYTGQYSNTADFGLMFYNARWVGDWASIAVGVAFVEAPPLAALMAAFVYGTSRAFSDIYGDMANELDTANEFIQNISKLNPDESWTVTYDPCTYLLTICSTGSGACIDVEDADGRLGDSLQDFVDQYDIEIIEEGNAPANNVSANLPEAI